MKVTLLPEAGPSVMAVTRSDAGQIQVEFTELLTNTFEQLLPHRFDFIFTHSKVCRTCKLVVPLFPVQTSSPLLGELSDLENTMG